VQDVLAQLGRQFAALSAAEIIAVVLAIGYLVLAIRQNIWCWFCAAGSTAIYVYLFFAARLYMESLLNAFYFLMALYGWSVWRAGGRRMPALPVSVWPLPLHGLALLVIVVSAGLSGYLLQRFTEAALPYIDSLTTFAAVWATFLVARKVLENWWYWLLIDAASVVIYWSRDLQLTALLFVIYLFMIPFGLISWRRSFILQNAGSADA
jgi:nicotinamide mononucleotide transporter